MTLLPSCLADAYRHVADERVVVILNRPEELVVAWTRRRVSASDPTARHRLRMVRAAFLLGAAVTMERGVR